MLQGGIRFSTCVNLCFEMIRIVSPKRVLFVFVFLKKKDHDDKIVYISLIQYKQLDVLVTGNLFLY
jgi:hypothetical protein